MRYCCINNGRSQTISMKNWRYQVYRNRRKQLIQPLSFQEERRRHRWYRHWLQRLALRVTPQHYTTRMYSWLRKVNLAKRTFVIPRWTISIHNRSQTKAALSTWDPLDHPIEKIEWWYFLARECSVQSNHRQHLIRVMSDTGLPNHPHLKEWCPARLIRWMSHGIIWKLLWSMDPNR